MKRCQHCQAPAKFRGGVVVCHHRPGCPLAAMGRRRLPLLLAPWSALKAALAGKGGTP